MLDAICPCYMSELADLPLEGCLPFSIGEKDLKDLAEVELGA